MRVTNAMGSARRYWLLCVACSACTMGWFAAAFGQEAAREKKAAAQPGNTPKNRTVVGDGRKQAPPTPPTYAKDVASILQTKCQSCHRRHQVGPFALDTYEQAKKRSQDIAAVTEERSMPPWKPTRGVGPKLKHDQSLTHDEIRTLAAWAEAGAPLGDPKDVPPPPKFAEGWKLGPPDLILEPAEGFVVPASGPDIYRCFVLPTNFAKDTYVEAVDFAPTERGAVHHLIAYIDTTGYGRQLDAEFPGPGYFASSGPGVPADELSFWTAGAQPHRLPDGVGIRIAGQADIIVQVHYHPTGKVGDDKTRVGLYLARKPIKQALHWNNASNYNFRLPAGKNNVEVKASWKIPVDVEAVAVSPHMHLLGRDMRMSVRLPNGPVENLIEIANWDPSWQSAYYFQKPITLPAGSTINVVAHFDNSAHSRNPNKPPKAVKFGPNFDDEMCVGYIALVKKGQDLTVPGARDELYEIFSMQRERLLRTMRTKNSH
jgi:Copper type II ascorbate-dependent monooxygenase, C-terminal domain